MQKLIDLALIDPNPWQPRTTDDPEHLQNLAISIAQDGLLQPPAARLVGERYQLVFGHSRYKAICYLNVTQQTDPNWFSDHGIHTSDNDWSCIPLEIIDLDDEGMYRQAISENLQRRDLNPIEEAQAMQRAMTDFGYNSAQVGELFGRSDATVRGMVRYLELPAGARDLLGRGEISQNSARALLSMQKIASAADVDVLAKQITQNDRSDITPEHLIDMTVRNRDNVKLLWIGSQNSDSKPRAGWRDGWLLDMNNFPNKMLPDFSSEEIIEMFGFKPESRQWWMVKNHFLSTRVLAQMMQTSDYETDRPQGDQLAQLVDPPACTSCKFYFKINGSHYCGLKLCYERKTIAWKREKIRAAGIDLGIEPYKESDGPFRAIEAHQDNGDKLFNERHEDLRLIERERVRGYPSQYSFKGVNTDVFLVVLVGKTLEAAKETKRQERALEKLGQKPIKQKYELIAIHRERLMWDAAGYFAKLFEPLNREAAEALWNSTPYWSEFGPENCRVAEIEDPGRDTYIRNALGLNVMRKLIRNFSYYGIVEMVEKLIEVAKICSVTLPEDLRDMAIQADAEIEEHFPTNPPVAVETEVDYAEK